MTGYAPVGTARPAVELLEGVSAPTGSRSTVATAASPQTPSLDWVELFSEALRTVGDFEVLSTDADDLVITGRSVKFLVDLRDETSPRVMFINGNYRGGSAPPDAAKYHYVFAKTVLGIPEQLDEFNSVTYFSPAKRYAAGVVHTYLLPNAEEPVYGLQFYPQDVIAERVLADVLQLVASIITIPSATLAFIATGQQQTVETVSAELITAGIEPTTIDRVLGSIRYIPLNLGDAWGYLRIFPAATAAVTPTDIPVYEELPLDLSVVAGVITRTVQDSSSHVNLKSKERGTPNMVLRDAGPSTHELAPFADQPVHLTVGPDAFLLETATPEEINARLAALTNRPWIRLDWDTETRVRSFAELAAGTPAECLAAARRYGSKAANLGFLTHHDVLGRREDTGSMSGQAGYDLVPAGLAVPLSFYDHFIKHPANATLRADLGALIDAEIAGQLSSAERAIRVSRVQHGFLTGTIPIDDLNAVTTKLADLLPDTAKFKVRSSANAEDVPNFDGAGLHDSFAASARKPSAPDSVCVFEVSDKPGGEVKRKVNPQSVACAIKGVYASLWNQRAIEERSFARIDHSTVVMGLAVVAAYDTESKVRANAVIITRVLNTERILGYTVSVQEGNNLVTNPDPGTESEIVIAALGVNEEPTTMTVTRYAKPVAGGATKTEQVLPPHDLQHIIDIAAAAEIAYCSAKPGYYNGTCQDVLIDGAKPAAVDLELKLLTNNHVICKQVREFGGK